MDWTISQKRTLTNFARSGWTVEYLALYFDCTTDEIIEQLAKSETEVLPALMSKEDLARKAYMDRLYPNKETAAFRRANAVLRVESRNGAKGI